MKVSDENSRIRIQDLDPDPLVRGSTPKCHGSAFRNTGFRAGCLCVKGTIEEGIHNIALEKLRLEQDVTGEGEDTTTKKKDVARLLKVFHSTHPIPYLSHCCGQ